MSNFFSERGQPSVKPTPARTPLPKRTVLPAGSTKTKFYTTKAQAQAVLNQPSDVVGQAIRFAAGRGYYLGADPNYGQGGSTLPPPPQQHMSLTPMQQAQLNVRRELAPQYAAAQQEADLQNRAITAYTAAVMQQLAGLAPQIQGDYNNAINAQQGMVDAAANSLRSVNPSGDVAALLNAVGAPAAQGQQIQGNLNNTFNGGAAVGQYVNGVSPLGALRSQGEAATTLARLQPSFQALAGRQALISALANQADARAKIAAQAPTMIQNQLDTFTKNSNARKQLAIEQAAAGIKQSNSDRSYKLSVARYNAQVTKWNAQQTTNATKIDPSVTKSINDGYAHNSQGAVVTGPDGKPIKVNIPVKSGTAPGGVKPPSDASVNSFLKSIVRQVPTTVTKNGTTVKTQVKTFTMNFMQAYKRLRAMRVPDAKARQYLQSIYHRGEHGRSWLTNEEQAVLKQASAKTAGPRVNLNGARTVKFHGHKVGVLSQLQEEWLRAANMLPPGEQGMLNGVPVYYIEPTY